MVRMVSVGFTPFVESVAAEVHVEGDTMEQSGAGPSETSHDSFMELASGSVRATSTPRQDRTTTLESSGKLCYTLAAVRYNIRSMMFKSVTKKEFPFFILL